MFVARKKINFSVCKRMDFVDSLNALRHHFQRPYTINWLLTSLILYNSGGGFLKLLLFYDWWFLSFKRLGAQSHHSFLEWLRIPAFFWSLNVNYLVLLKVVQCTFDFFSYWLIECTIQTSCVGFVWINLRF